MFLIQHTQYCARKDTVTFLVYKTEVENILSSASKVWVINKIIGTEMAENS
jgi:hypothetical protein